ncbi:hypothetical protein TWF788_001788 [Orbilia oligospora]|uniref:Uncharacterized protein n=1 Tax=Orbilia oligospora TaxID=2813651 RepID=A0A7C8KCL2_ORBOL|nr:hypothetical protein TWF788_001788 [Orbilia oligospora]
MNPVTPPRKPRMTSIKKSTEAPPENKLQVPGLGLPLTYESENAFPHGLLSYCPLVMTLREIDMLKAMNLTTDKPDWTTKIYDPAITEKWRSEIKSQLDFTDKMFDWCLAELKTKAEQFQKEKFVIAIDGDVCKSDTLITEETRLEIIEAIKVLEDVPESQKDWHPGSNDQVLDLVHPSLFPLAYGKSRIVEDKLITLENCLENIGTGVVIELKDNSLKLGLSKSKGNISVPHAWSKNFQWLPADVSLKEVEGNRVVKFESYINNLHPRHTTLYRLVETVILKSIPMWSQTLLAASAMDNTEIRLPWSIEYDFDEEDVPADLYSDDDDEDAQWDKAHDWKQSMREQHVIQPEAPHYRDWVARVLNYDGDLELDLWEKFKSKGLQVIVKFASIHLTPEKSRYDGGSWHYEGQLNDHIVATSIYYYSNENITPSSLKFRHEVNAEDAIEWPYSQNEHEFMNPLFGIGNEEAAVQNIGEVDTKQGRLVTFPNTLQHQVQPFKLEDPTKPGHRKILVVFLVDPHTRVISTANVPPQRKDWWEEVLNTDSGKRLNRLPQELRDMIVDSVDDFPIDMETAKKMRVELMGERRTYVENQNRELEENTFSLCEH